MMANAQQVSCRQFLDYQIFRNRTRKQYRNGIPKHPDAGKSGIGKVDKGKRSERRPDGFQPSFCGLFIFECLGKMAGMGCCLNGLISCGLRLTGPVVIIRRQKSIAMVPVSANAFGAVPHPSAALVSIARPESTKGKGKKVQRADRRFAVHPESSSTEF